jgi:hypothetical protein
MSDETDLLEARAMLHDFDLGPLPPLDLDQVIHRGHRHRQVVAIQVCAAVVVAVAAVGAGIVTVHGRLAHTPPPAATVTPTPSPTTATARVTAAMNAMTAADSVHVVAQLGRGITLDVVVTQAGAVGTLTEPGKSATYLGVGDALYIKNTKGDLLADVFLPAAGSHGRWTLLTGAGSVNTCMNLSILRDFLYPPYGTAATLGQRKTVNGVPTIGIVDAGAHEFVEYVEVDPPYRPVLLETPDHLTSWTLSDWNAPTPSLPAAPDPAILYRPLES